MLFGLVRLNEMTVDLKTVEAMLANGVKPGSEVLKGLEAFAAVKGVPATYRQEADELAKEKRAAAAEATASLPKIDAAVQAKVEQLKKQIEQTIDGGECRKYAQVAAAKEANERAAFLEGLL
jgi:hypothetical protein